MRVKDKITISLLRTDILEQSADVIINTVDPEVSLSEGLAK